MIIWVILGIICILYGLLVRAAGSGTAFFMVWILLALLCFAAACALKTGFIFRLPATIKILIGVIVACGLLILCVTQFLVIRGFSQTPPKGLDVIIVLGAQVDENGPRPVTRYRLDKAFEYLCENENTVCITSGGKGINEYAAEGYVMREYLIEKGIGEDRVIAETGSRNTIQNIENCRELFDVTKNSVGIVTNNFHVFRGTRLAKHAGYKEVYGIASYSNPIYLPNNMLRESFGILKDLVAGNLI